MHRDRPNERLTFAEAEIGEDAVEFTRLETTEPGDMPEATDDVATKSITPIWGECHPALLRVDERREQGTGHRIPEAHKIVVTSCN